jgi:hypothetical protein
VTTSLLNAVFIPPLEIVHRSGQQLLIILQHFLPDGIHQLAQITWFVNAHGTSGTARGRNHKMTCQVTLGAMTHRRSAK